MNKQVTVTVSWEKHNYLQSGMLCIDCNCYFPCCNSYNSFEDSRSLFEQTYHGGYDIYPYKTPNGQIINGGYSSPDFTMTEQDIENHIIPEEYRNKITVVFKYLQDDREIKANSLDMFF